ncbi:MAG: hypothetical protein HY049_14765 [Acidobacteria bacterium]|nr:hypothetical protein [Acidobacteriota bacterium]
MLLRTRTNGARRLLMIGMSFLALANVWHQFLVPVSSVGAGAADGIFGFLMGISIGCNLVSVMRRRGPREEA